MWEFIGCPVFVCSYRSKIRVFGFDLPVRDNAFCYLTDQDEEQDEGEEPAEVVSRKVKPGTVMDVDF